MTVAKTLQNGAVLVACPLELIMLKQFIFSTIVSFIVTGSAFAESNYPQRINVITKVESNYSSPENSLYSIRSCIAAEDLSWCDETMTSESLQTDIQLFEKAGADRRQIFALEKNVKESFIVNKIAFNDAVILIVENYTYSGSIHKIPMPFVVENGKWKLTNKYSSVNEFKSLFYYVPPLFDGKGQKPVDANSFLGYEQPTQVQTDLPAGSSNYMLHVYFGKSINPATFTAKLNKKDISQRFSPKPFTDEEVDIPLQQGRNVLVLSVEGIRKDGRKATDTDRLVFIVP